MVSFQANGQEIIDQSTKNLFEERFAGLGALIGPHFYRRKAEILPILNPEQEALFPHIARIKAHKTEDPFSHGIGRYAPWEARATDSQVIATLGGKSLWNGIPLAQLEGQNFKMTFIATLFATHLQLDLSVVSDYDSVIGIHYYYQLPQRKGIVRSRVQSETIFQNQRISIPESWNMDAQNLLTLELNQPFDHTFFPFPNPLDGKITLDTSEYRLQTTYQCPSQENAWQLYHPADGSFVCIEPVSSQDPRHPNLTVSSISIQLQVLSIGQNNE